MDQRSRRAELFQRLEDIETADHELWDTSGVAIAQLDGDRFIKVSPSLCQLVGLPEAELLSTDPFSIFDPRLGGVLSAVLDPGARAEIGPVHLATRDGAIRFDLTIATLPDETHDGTIWVLEPLE